MDCETFYENEIDALDIQLEAGEITRQQYNQAVYELNTDMREQEDRQDIIAAGRGHLLR